MDRIAEIRPYDIYETADLLDRPYPSTQKFLDEDEVRFLGSENIEPVDEAPINPSEIKNYLGPWYFQRSEPTCLPWNVANASRIQEELIDPNCLTNLLNIAITPKPFDQGMSYFQAMPEIKRLSSLNLKQGEPGNSLIQIPSGADNSQVIEITERNIALIKIALGEGRCILTSVFNEYYIGRQGRHALCISGYQINNQGRAFAQLTDPARGLIWTSVDHISKAVVPNDTYYLIPKRTALW